MAKRSAEQIYGDAHVFHATLVNECRYNRRWASGWYYCLAILGAIGVVAAAAASVFAVLKDAGQLNRFAGWTTVLIGVSGACFFIVQHLKFADRANAHFKRYNALHGLLIRFEWERTKAAEDEDLAPFIDEYCKVIGETDKLFAAITTSLAQPVGGDPKKSD